MSAQARIARAVSKGLSFELSFLTWGRLLGAGGCVMGVLLVIIALAAERLGFDSYRNFDLLRLALISGGLAALLLSVGFLLPQRLVPLQKISPGLAALLEKPVRPWLILLHIVVLGPIFFGYLLTFSIQSHPLSADWLFGADNVKRIYFAVMDGWGAHRHIAFVVFAVPLFRIARAATGIFFEDPIGLNLSFVFPVALAGVMNVYLAFRIFLASHRDKLSAVLFTSIYGFAASIWIFSSFPDTHIITTLATNIFLLVLISQSGAKSTRLALVGSNALAAFAAPQQLLLAIIPWTSYVLRNFLTRRMLVLVLRYGLYLGVTFFIPYALFLSTDAVDIIQTWANIRNLIDPVWYILVPLNLLVFSVIGPIVHPNSYGNPDLLIFGQLPILWIILAVAFSVFALRCLVGVNRSPAKAGKWASGILLFELVYIALFIFFDPRESFIFSAASLLPWLIIVHAGYVGIKNRAWQIVLMCLIVGIAVNNSMLMIYVNDLVEMHPENWPNNNPNANP